MTSRTRIKICGITSEEDAALAVEAGADAVGLVFYRGSPRYVSMENAARIVRSLPPFVTSVGLFVDVSGDEIEEALARTGVSVLQFHGDESPADCAASGQRWIKAGRVGAGFDVAGFVAEYEGAHGWLLDSRSEQAPGGTGETFDWARVPAGLAGRIILAGGLDADNVGAAIAQVRPYAVDVSSGVERSPGIKDRARLQAFTAAVRAADGA